MHKRTHAATPRLELLEVRRLLATTTAEGPPSATEGAPYRLTLPAFVGGVSPSSYEINWGDGSAVTTAPVSTVGVNHVYDDGPAAHRVTTRALVAGQWRDVPARIRSGGVSPAPDPDFGQGGRAAGHSDQRVQALAAAPGGKYVVAGRTPLTVFATQYLADGTTDSTFGASGVANHTLPTNTLRFDAREALVRPDGKVIVGGTWYGTDDRVVWGIAQFNAEGRPDTTFGTGGLLLMHVGTSHYAASFGDMALQPDGKLVVVGNAIEPSPALQNMAVARLMPNGSLDPDFNSGGTASIHVNGRDGADAVLIQPDGKIVVAGNAGEDNYLALLRLTSAGQLDVTFGTGGVARRPTTLRHTVNDVLLDGDGRLVVAGAVGEFFSDRNIALWRYLPDGTPDANFGQNGMATAPNIGSDDVAFRGLIQGDGKLVAVGEADGAPAFWRVLSNGQADPTLGPGGTAVTPAGRPGAFPTDAEITPDGYLYTAEGGGAVGANFFTRYLPESLVRVANAPPTAVFTGSSLVSPTDPSAADRAAGYRYSFDVGNDGVFEIIESATNSAAVPAGTPAVRGRIHDKDGGFTDYTMVTGSPGYPEARVFYNNSVFDGFDPGASAADDAAVATDKFQYSGIIEFNFNNATTYSRGINGVMVDIHNLPTGSLEEDDFLVRTGPGTPSAGWSVGPRPSTITVRRGAGGGGSDRVTLTFPDYSIRNTWLELTVAANADTGLARPVGFRFANLVGETGTSQVMSVTQIDAILTRRQRNTSAAINNRYDFNRDGLVNVIDFAISRANVGRRLATTNPLSPDWFIGSEMPVPLGEVAGGIIRNKLYLVGEGNSATLVYDIVSGTWSGATSLARRPFQGHHHAAEVIDGKLYLFGGLGGSSGGKVQIYDPVNDTWTRGADMPFAAGSSSSAVINGQAYVAGGIVGSSTTDRVAQYDPATNRWTELPRMPQGRNHAASGTDGFQLFVFGGRGPGSGDGNTVANGFNTVQIYNPFSNTWVSSATPGSTIRPLPQARGGMGKAVFDRGEFYILGGETATGAGATADRVYRRVDVYNPFFNTWREGTPMLTARHGIFPLLHNFRIYVAGGGVRAGASASALVEIFNLPRP